MLARVLAIFLIVLSGVSPAFAAEWKTVPIELRDPNTPIPIAIYLPQDELLIGVDPLLKYSSGSHGLVGDLMLDVIESSANKKAGAEVEPVLDALGEFDASVPLMSGIRAEISISPWLTLLTDTPAIDDSEDTKNSLLAQVTGNYLVDVDCAYRIGREFEAIYATCSLQIVDKRLTSNRWKPGNLLFNQMVQSEVALDIAHAPRPIPSCYGSERRAWCRSQWTKDSAAKLRDELTIALTKVGNLVGKRIRLSGEQADTSSLSKDTLIRLAPSHSGFALQGAANVQDPGKRPGMWSGFKPAVLAPDSDGVVLVTDDGSLYHKRVVTVH